MPQSRKRNFAPIYSIRNGSFNAWDSDKQESFSAGDMIVFEEILDIFITEQENKKGLKWDVLNLKLKEYGSEYDFIIVQIYLRDNTVPLMLMTIAENTDVFTGQGGTMIVYGKRHEGKDGTTRVYNQILFKPFADDPESVDELPIIKMKTRDIKDLPRTKFGDEQNNLKFDEAMKSMVNLLRKTIEPVETVEPVESEVILTQDGDDLPF